MNINPISLYPITEDILRFFTKKKTQKKSATLHVVMTQWFEGPRIDETQLIALIFANLAAPH